MSDKTLVLGTYVCGKTGRAIAKELGARYESKSIWNDTMYDLVIRYGNGYSGLPPNRRTVMNYAKNIHKVASKASFRYLLLRNEISAPKLYDEVTIDESSFPLIARPVNHYKGKHFHIVRNVDDFRKWLEHGYYFQEIIDKDTEFRLFIFKDRIMEANIKIPTSVSANEMIRNHSHGWSFSPTPVAGIQQDLKNEARYAAQIGGLTFCAVDCCISTDGKPYIFEVNSAPSLIPRKVGALVERIKETYGLN